MPELPEDLCEINARYNNIIILDDLMAEATDSPVVSRLFTHGRHRNAQYLTLFRSPSDRKQIGIIGERMFDKNRVHFITVNARRLVRLASDVTKYVIVHFLFWSRDQYRASMLKSHIQITM